MLGASEQLGQGKGLEVLLLLAVDLAPDAEQHLDDRGAVGLAERGAGGLPAADLVVSQDHARVLIELAGVPRESVRVTLRGRTLEISERRMPPADRTDALYHRAEIFFGDFRRTIELPSFDERRAKRR